MLGHLLASAEQLGPGLGWYTPPELLPPWQAELAPEGYYNLGVAHGMPAVVVLLARAIAAGIRVGELRPLLDGAVAYLLAQRGPEGFPSWVPKGKKAAARRPASPGATATRASPPPCSAAAEALGRPDWAAIAAGVAREAAARDPELAGITDCGICHGAVGLAHIWNRLWQASGDPRLAAAARYWFGRALAMRREDAGIGGFQSWSTPRGQPRRRARLGRRPRPLDRLGRGGVVPAWRRSPARSRNGTAPSPFRFSSRGLRGWPASRG